LLRSKNTTESRYPNIQEVAEKTGISAYTIRFYEKSGVLPHIQRAENGVRQFSEADVNFLLFLMELKKTGMSLEEITEFTEETSPSSQWRGASPFCVNTSNASMSNVAILITCSVL
jgi:DNA-binding transcriptional MerR regulator